MSGLTDAIRHLEQGDWEAAHVIVQDDPSALAAWAHGIVHILEGDLGNARYWYRRAGRQLGADADGAGASRQRLVADEIAALKEAAGAVS